MSDAPAPQTQQPAKGGKGGGIILILIIAAVVGGIVFLQKKARENAAKAIVDGKAAFEAKNWEQAYTLIEQGLKLADDPAAKTIAADARKNHRDALVADAAKATDPDVALATLEKANGVSTSPEVVAKIEETRYAAGKKAFDAKKWDRAVLLFGLIPAFKDAKALGETAKLELDYAEAEGFLAKATEAAKAGKALDAVAAIGSARLKAPRAPEGKPPIEAAAAKVKDALYDWAATSKDEDVQLVTYRALGEHKDAADKVKALEPKLYGQAKDALNRGDLARAKGLLLALASYKDAAQLLKETGARAGTPKATWTAVGKPGEYKGTRLLVALDGCLWSTDGGGTLWKTDATGKKSQVGKGGTWQKTAALVVMPGPDAVFYSVEKDGSVYKTDKTGKYDTVATGQFGDVRALVAIDGALYSLEGGDLYRTEVASGKWAPVGEHGTWKDTRLAVGFKGKIWSVEGTTGTLYRTKPNGNSEKVGKDGEWKDTEWMVVAGDFIYSVEKDGTLYRTDATGAYKQVGEGGGFKDTVGVAAEGDAVWTIEVDGTLYRTTIKND